MLIGQTHHGNHLCSSPNQAPPVRVQGHEPGRASGFREAETRKSRPPPAAGSSQSRRGGVFTTATLVCQHHWTLMKPDHRQKSETPFPLFFLRRPQSILRSPPRADPGGGLVRGSYQRMSFDTEISAGSARLRHTMSHRVSPTPCLN